MSKNSKTWVQHCNLIIIFLYSTQERKYSLESGDFLIRVSFKLVGHTVTHTHTPQTRVRCDSQQSEQPQDLTRSCGQWVFPDWMGNAGDRMSSLDPAAVIVIYRAKTKHTPCDSTLTVLAEEYDMSLPRVDGKWWRQNVNSGSSGSNSDLSCQNKIYTTWQYTDGSRGGVWQERTFSTTPHYFILLGFSTTPDYFILQGYFQKSLHLLSLFEEEHCK